MRRLAGTTLAAVALAAAAAAPAAARIPPPSLFGLNTGTFDPNYAHYVRDLPAARALGARWVHFTGSLVKSRRGRARPVPRAAWRRPGGPVDPRRHGRQRPAVPRRRPERARRPAHVRSRRGASVPLPPGGPRRGEEHRPGRRRQRAARLEGRA